MLATTRKGRPPLVVGGTCSHGHVLAAGDIINVGQTRTCRICKNATVRRNYYGLSAPYRLTTHYRCGHPNTPENNGYDGRCKECHNARVRDARHNSSEQQARQEGQRNRRAAIMSDWLAGKEMREIAADHGVSHQRIAQIVEREGGVTIRVRRSDLAALGIAPAAIAHRRETPTAALARGIGDTAMGYGDAATIQPATYQE